MGDHLKKARLLKGLIRGEAGAVFGVSGATMKSWETGETAPRSELRERIVSFLGYDPGDWTASPGKRNA